MGVSRIMLRSFHAWRRILAEGFGLYHLMPREHFKEDKGAPGNFLGTKIASDIDQLFQHSSS